MDGDTRSWFQIVSRSPSGYVLTLQAGNLQISGKDLRTLLGLRSTNFTITAQTDSFLFTTKGYGHGVGSANTAQIIWRAKAADMKKSYFIIILAHSWQKQ